MKNLLITAFLLFITCTICSIQAQVCKISNSNDNVEVFSAFIIDNSRVEVSVGNDSQSISANITVEIEVTYTSGSSNKTLKYTGKTVAKPNDETTINIPIKNSHPDNSNYKPSSVKVIGISGTKCM